MAIAYTSNKQYNYQKSYWKTPIEKIYFIKQRFSSMAFDCWYHSPQPITSHAIFLKLVWILKMDFPVLQIPDECWHAIHFRSVQITKHTHALIYCGTINGITCFATCINTHAIYVSVISLEPEVLIRVSGNRFILPPAIEVTFDW